ncbi:hypothetical protein KAR91_46680 [Candidatus Pacearchaeota archaeon]|nr:hypothetical protein [Candidatus Pacearchaeota archaeon]
MTTDTQNKINELSYSIIELKEYCYYVGKRRKIKLINKKLQNLTKRKLYKQQSLMIY